MELTPEQVEWLLMYGPDDIQEKLTDLVRIKTGNKRLRRWYDSKYEEGEGNYKGYLNERFFVSTFICRICDQHLFTGTVLGRNIDPEAKRLLRKHELVHVKEIIEEERKVGPLPSVLKK